MKELLFLIVLFVSNVIQAITGFAGTVLAMPPSVYLLGLDHAKVILNAMAWFSGLMIAVTGYRHINWKELIKMSGFMLVGMFAGVQICRVVESEDVLLTLYGIVIVAVALKNLCIHSERKFSPVILGIILLLAGIIHGMFVSGGALLVIYATQVLKDKEEFRATVAPVWVVLNSCLMFTQMRAGLIGQADVRLILISIVPLLVATCHGTGVAMPQEHLPLIAIPTTAGTGSEVTCVSVLSDHANGKKAPIVSEGFYPEAAIIDPELTYTMPPHITAGTGIDVLSHAIEGYWSKGHQPICDVLAMHAR